MPRKPSNGSAEEFFPDKLTLPSLREAAADCKACDLWKRGTQTVFGEGGRRSVVMFVCQTFQVGAAWQTPHPQKTERSGNFCLPSLARGRDRTC